MTLYKLTERYTGERDVYVEAESKSEALAKARNDDIIDEGDPIHFGWRYVGPVTEAEGPAERELR